jgi:hypothetical protein
LFHLLKSETVDLTPEFVTKFRELPGSPTERDVRRKRVDFLREKATSGQLVNFNWVIAQLEEKEYRMNGQHSSLMLSELNGNFPKDLKVHLDTFKVDDKEGLALLFRQYDSRHSTRSLSDISGAYQGLHENLQEVPKDVAKYGIEGIVWYNHNVESLPTPSGEDAYTLFADGRYHEFLKWTSGILSIKTPEMKRVPVLAAMYATYKTSKKDAGEFWEEVARCGIGSDDAKPSTLLDNWLVTATDKKNVTLKPGQVYQGAIYCWNAYRSDRQIRDVRYDTKKGFIPVSD